MEDAEFVIGVDGAGLFKQQNQYIIIFDDVIIEILEDRASAIKGQLEGVYDPDRVRTILRDEAVKAVTTQK